MAPLADLPFRLDAVADPATIAADWRVLSRDGIAVPFQTADWVTTWVAAGALPRGARMLLVRGRLGEATVFVLPLVVERQGPVVIARRLGASHAGYVLGVWRADAFAALNPAALAAALLDLGRRERIDAFALDAVPRTWTGVPVPLAGVGAARTSLDDAHLFRLDPSFDALLAGRNAGHKRKKVRAKEKLLDAAGGYRIAAAATEAEIDAALAAFFAQKGVSLAARGVPDSFADPGVRAAWRGLAVASLGRHEPLLELTTLEAGGAIRAVIGASILGERLYALFASYAQDDLVRASPGETLFFRHIEAACRRGLSVYDMGLGSERYKASWCDDRVDLVDVRLTVSGLGRLWVAAEDLVGRAKAAIRRDERLWPLVKRLRARLAGRERAGEGEREGE